MQLSRFNIVTEIKDSQSYIIINQLSGSADILEPAVGKSLLAGTISDEKSFIEKGYLVNPEEEDALYTQKYHEFIARRDADEIQIFFVPWYACNFNCSYCYQSSYENHHTAVSNEVIDAFFNYVTTTFSGKRYYITLFGGEPLLTEPFYRSAVEHFFATATSNNVSVAVVTNGYNLAEYVPMLSKSLIREIQVTLDGPREIHDARRPLRKESSPTFDRIVTGIDTALAANLPVNFRMVVDRENLGHLPALARFAKERGWTDNKLFKTQLGRNYELHHCASNPDILYSRIAMYEAVYALSKEHPETLEFHKPAYSITRFLAENGTLPDPLFDACPGGKTEWALDYTGAIYSCTATVGKADEKLGTFFPEVSLSTTMVNEWTRRDVTTIEKCSICPLQLSCGGGCGSVAKNRTGTLYSPDCRPIKELVGLGVAAYFGSEV